MGPSIVVANRSTNCLDMFGISRERDQLYLYIWSSSGSSNRRTRTCVVFLVAR